MSTRFRIRTVCILTALLLPMSALARQEQSTQSNAATASDPQAALSDTDAATRATGTTQVSGATETGRDATAAGSTDRNTAEPADATSTQAQTEGKTDSGPPIAPPPAGKGQIVFFRPAKFAGSAVGYKVREGATELGKLRSGKYFVLPVEPGPHAYVVHSEARDVLNLEVEPDETYYVKGTLTMGILAGRPNLSPATREDFVEAAFKLERVDPIATE